ncbi:MAG: hypothetical protein MJD61_03715 [Proteobacteria bacterium]|nr:hypothetical protein [Pseudomonadota bacterium]
MMTVSVNTTAEHGPTRRHTLRRLAAGLAACAAACGGSSESLPDVREPAPATASGASQGQWPTTLLVIADKGPALFIGQNPVGFVALNSVVRVVGPAQGAMLPVRVDGPLTAQANMPLARLGARIQRKGRLRGAPVYVGPNDVVKVLGPAGGKRTRVEATVELGGGHVVGPFVGTYPTVGLSGAEADPARFGPLRPGKARQLRDTQTLAVHAKPSPAAPVVAVLPALQPPVRLEVIKAKGSWSAIRAGQGPYIIGFVQGELQASSRPAPTKGIIGAAYSSGTLPSYLKTEEGVLHRVRAGAKVYFDNRELAHFRQAGFAREQNRFDDGTVDVYAAADGRVAVRGLLRADALEPYGAAPSMVPAAAPAVPGSLQHHPRSAPP